MANIKIKARVDTIIKHLTIDAVGLPSSQKFPLTAGSEIGINWFRSAANNHWEFERIFGNC